MKPIDFYWKNLIRGGGGLLGAPLRCVLWTISKAYSVISSFRHFGYDRGWFKHRRPQGPVIVSIGNIVVGGTGKTPVVLKFAHALQAAGSLAILTRGYRSPAEKAHTPVYIAPGQSSSAAICGDEPCLMAQQLPQAHLVVGRNRYTAAKMAVGAGVKLLLLDDGMQHRQLARDFDVAVVDADHPFGGGYLFPRGILRESPKGLARAHLIVLNHVRSSEHFQHAQQQVRLFSTAPVVGMRPKVSAVIPLMEGTSVDASLHGVKVGVFCGIAHPERFVDTALSLGVEVVGTLFSADHKLPSRAALEAFAMQCKEQGAIWLLCTEKDVVKLSACAPMALPIASVHIELEVVEGLDHWSKLIDQIRGQMQNI